MPSESSVYRKIQVVLDVAKSVKVQAVEDLWYEIEGLKLANFLTRQYDNDRDRFVTDTSQRAIRRAVDFCRLLQLIGEDGGLTHEGRQALRKTQFDKIVAVQIRSFLKHKGINLSEVNKVINKGLQSNPPVLPTSQELWMATGHDTHYPVFSRMLTLLGQCGGARSSQKKIYLHVDIT